jgi:hypothetical protein
MRQTRTSGYTRGGIMCALELYLLNISLVQADHLTSVADRSINVQSCDVTEIRFWSGTLLWGRAVWRHLLLVSSAKQICLMSRPGNIEVGPAKNSSLLLFHIVRQPNPLFWSNREISYNFFFMIDFSTDQDVPFQNPPGDNPWAFLISCNQTLDYLCKSRASLVGERVWGEQN